MNTIVKNFTVTLSAGLFALLLAGCYTQIGVTRGEQAPPADDQYAYDQEYSNDSTYESEQPYTGEDGWQQQRPWYPYDYYYPTLGYPGYYHYPYGWQVALMYDPFWCGTSYPGYYAGSWYGYPWYRYRYNDGPLVGHAGGIYPGTGRGGNTTRTIGNFRGSSSASGSSYVPTRTPGSGSALPTGARLGSSTTGRSSTPSATSRGGSPGRREGTVRQSPAPRSGGREGVRKEQSGTQNRPSGSSGHRGESGSRSGGGSSYTPPPAQSAPPSAPPPSSSGSSAPANTGSRGSGTRR